MDMEAKVVISYKSISKRGPVTFQLLVDSRKVGEVTGFEQEYAVEPGRHVAEVQCTLIKTNQVDFSLASGDEVRLVCYPNFWIILVPLSIVLIFSILSVIPYNPTVMLYAGGAFVVLAPIYVVFMVMKPGMLVKLKRET